MAYPAPHQCAVKTRYVQNGSHRRGRFLPSVADLQRHRSGSGRERGDSGVWLILFAAMNASVRAFAPSVYEDMMEHPVRRIARSASLIAALLMLGAAPARAASP